MPRVLSESDVADFRERLCDAAEKLFAEKGPDAVTMRQLAAELGVSPMTPYRYFTDKEDILAAVRTNGFNRFAEALETALAHTQGSAKAKSSAVGEAYLNFAFEHPQTYKLMFDLNQPHEQDYPELVAAASRANAMRSAYIKGLVEAGVMEGDPEEIGRMYWAATHGAVTLELAGKLPKGMARIINRQLGHTLAKGLRPGA
ncbi:MULTISPECIES: TetR/AcrR family transcriptional regulator [unclassified Phenylobacterium]|uniref:TetR/AcrR family transcriptional regulator n=1 Tax=unclassified Phenylobacterium TaxID=2640670 RepID=UPI002264DFDC|nr:MULTISPECIES: TetR/AcrR family transcriptional regulator [unclassified Phenylobacterium]MBS0492289.1 TetR/AcrR family transcriptional regulator [Pseudomonadota bacterium]MCX7587597.1 TetR/AcrR family transcriptional regulator [Phenylobacterium sp. 58.2.17]WGU39501.1 TetR/AcrR family transcriptional regulator [Phenylobacterium sp. NIBR 498073]